LRAGYVGLTEIYTHEVAHAHNAAGDALRMKLNDTAKGTSMWFSGVGSLMNVHFGGQGRSIPDSIRADDDQLKELFYFEMLHAGIYMSKRGYITLSLEITAEHRELFVSAVRGFLGRYAEYV
jgi:glutamate-1-semialdehyde 2,1-aminomutase